MAFKEICIKNKSCELMKSVNMPKYGSRTILTDSCWEYVSLLKRLCFTAILTTFKGHYIPDYAVICNLVEPLQ